MRLSGSGGWCQDEDLVMSMRWQSKADMTAVPGVGPARDPQHSQILSLWMSSTAHPRTHRVKTQTRQEYLQNKERKSTSPGEGHFNLRNRKSCSFDSDPVSP